MSARRLPPMTRSQKVRAVRGLVAMWFFGMVITIEILRSAWKGERQ